MQFALPDWTARSEEGDAAAGAVEERDGRGTSARISWDTDPRPGAVSADQARAASGLPSGEVVAAQADGHAAILVRGASGAALVWRCAKSRRLFRLQVRGPRAPDAAALGARVRCHTEPVLTNGDVPAASAALLGSRWRYANRDRASISWVSDAGVLTFFAGQRLPAVPDAGQARRAAPAWVLAAGLSDVVAQDVQAAAGPQGHPGLRVSGSARLDGEPVLWTLLFWHCLQRQRSFAALTFGQRAPDAGALLAARCHG